MIRSGYDSQLMQRAGKGYRRRGRIPNFAKASARKGAQGVNHPGSFSGATGRQQLRVESGDGNKPELTDSGGQFTKIHKKAFLDSQFHSLLKKNGGERHGSSWRPRNCTNGE